MTEKVYEELDDAKAEIEKLKSENLVKANLCDNLKRLNNDQLKRIQELNLKLEKQGQEVEAKADEVYAAQQSLGDLECKLREKEKVIVSLTSANDKLRVDFNSKLRACEAEKEKLVCSLEEANAKVLNLEDQNHAFMDKIEVLREGILSVSQKKCASESKMAKASKQMRERGDMFEKLEEEKVKLEEQLKWKNEQFKHLEEAHEKLRNNLRAKEKEWDMERCSFFDDISTLETKLDSHITLSEDLKSRLELCKQALAHEEDRRKCLEIQLSESNSCVVDTKSKLESLTIEKECICNEMECKITEMEEENQELVLSLKKLKESQIREAGNSSSIIKLQNKIKTLEEVNNVREAEWTSLFEKIVAELNCCRFELQSKDTRLKEITKEVDDYSSLALQLTIEREEFALMMVALKSTLLETKSKVDDEKLLLHNQLVRTKSELMSVTQLLDMTNEELDQIYCEVNEVEFELQIWKSVAEKLQVDLEVNHRMRRELEASLLAQVATEVNVKEDLKQKVKRVNDLEQEIKELKENNTLWRNKEIEQWEKEWVAKELEAAILAQLESERIHENEKKNLNQLVEEKDQRINNLQHIMSSLEIELDDSTASFSLQLAKMQAEVNLFHEAWEKMRTTVVLKEIEVQEKGLVIIELENDLENRIRFVKKCLSSVKKLSSENEKLMSIIDGASEWINKLSREDGQVMGALRSIMSGFDENHWDRNGCSGSKERYDPVKENMNVYQCSSPKRNVVENSVDERSPLRTING
ncbi:hypothetical protein L1987_45480 [Smallanthus sonchifolius]|uniref:Uncharacterized protein n=1 Tax=Smallanthus sonchifolius TaxID=185202 RepID=A0ACB9FY45_9ASTR|nr:hypothetical protein L1987_45480 [Smallanthus sonchifolius]